MVILSQYWTFLYCSSNFCLLVHGYMVYRHVDWFMASFLNCFPYSYHSSNYCDSNSCHSFTLLIFSLLPLRAMKSDIYSYRNSWESDNFRKRAIKKEAKNCYQKRMQKGLRVKTLQGEIDKNQILLSKYWKKMIGSMAP